MKSTHRIGIRAASLALLAVGVGVVSAAYSGFDGERVLHEDSAIVAQGSCTECSACSAGGHKAPIKTDGSLSSVHSYCISTLCSHPGCLESANPDQRVRDLALRNLIRDAARGDEGAMRGLLVDHPDRAVINRNREAIQVTSCNGSSLMAHVPLSPRQVAMLASVAPGDRAE